MVRIEPSDIRFASGARVPLTFYNLSDTDLQFNSCFSTAQQFTARGWIDVPNSNGLNCADIATDLPAGAQKTGLSNELPSLTAGTLYRVRLERLQIRSGESLPLRDRLSAPFLGASE